jgi:hypothetical protein
LVWWLSTKETAKSVCNGLIAELMSSFIQVFFINSKAMPVMTRAGVVYPQNLWITLCVVLLYLCVSHVAQGVQKTHVKILQI